MVESTPHVVKVKLVQYLCPGRVTETKAQYWPSRSVIRLDDGTHDNRLKHEQLRSDFVVTELDQKALCIKIMRILKSLFYLEIFDS